MRQRFLYFIPGVNGCSEQSLQSLGLYHRFVGGNGRLDEWSVRPWEGGPNNLNGVLLASSQRPLEYLPTQTWMECGKFWVGIENPSAAPGPMDLTRSVHLDGESIELGDRNLWRVPRVLRWDRQAFCHEVALPMVTQLRIVDGRPQAVRGVMPQFKPLMVIAERVWRSFVEKQPIPMEQIFQDAAQLLTMNYRVGIEEIGLLGLLNDSLAQQVVRQCVDIATIDAQAEELLGQGLVPVDVPPDVDDMAGKEVTRG